MKKKCCFVLAVLLVLTMSISACTTAPVKEKDKLQVVCTIFPIYDWVRELTKGVEDKVEVTLLVNNGADLHNYQPSVVDIAKITSSDMFFYVGGESDAWVNDVVAKTQNENLQAVSLMEMLGETVKEEEIVEGMESEEEEHNHEDADHADEKDHEHTEEEVVYDEHVWLSLNNANVCCDVISKKLAEADTANSATYQLNYTSYTQKIQELNQSYIDEVGKAKLHTLIFADRFPFRYLADDYQLKYYAAFVGCSAETEASFETITFLAEKADEEDVPVILVIESSDIKIAETVIENTNNKNRKIMVLNSLQSVKAEETTETYLGVMQENLEVLKQALN